MKFSMVIYVAIRQMYVDVLYLNVTQTINNNMIIKNKRETSAMVDYKLALQLQNNIRDRRGKKTLFTSTEQRQLIASLLSNW